MFRANLIARWKPQIPSGKPRLRCSCDGCDVGLGVCVVEAATRGCRFGEDHEGVDRQLEYRSKRWWRRSLRRRRANARRVRRASASATSAHASENRMRHICGP
eukprot:5421397-Pleurochrysis_carterae.AAC.1